MESHGTDTGVDPAPRWYSRAALDEFEATADAERSRLESVIADASARLARAGAAVGMNRTMAEMLLRSQQEIQAIRREAEITAAAILDGRTETASTGSPVSPTEVPPPDPTLRVPDPVPSETGPAVSIEPDTGHDDQYFSRLKDMLGAREGLGSLNDD